MEEPSDETLLARSRAGDGEGLAMLVRRYERPLFNYLRRVLLNREDAEDVFQETFLRVRMHQDRFRADGRFKPWFFQIATNLARDRLRARKRWRMLPLFASDADALPALADRLVAPGPDPEAAARASEASERLEAALARLPMRHRVVYLMARHEHMAYAEIAEALEIPEGTVKSRMHKAVQSLLSELKG